MLNIVLFSFGLLCLWKGGDWLVEGGKGLGRYFNVPEILIGLTVIAFGTSAPELIVNVIASIQNNHDIIFGNVFGSNNANTLLIVGVSALIYPLSVKSKLFKQEVFFYFITLLALSILLFRHIPPIFSLLDSLIFFVLFAIFLALVFLRNKRSEDDKVDISDIRIGPALLMLALGMILLPLGGKCVVDSAVNIARSFGLSEALIAATIVAIGTSLPELAASVSAALKREPEMVAGNIIGSNIFNLLLILGVSGAINPIPFNSSLFIDFAVMWGGLIAFVLLGLSPKAMRFGRIKGFLLTTSYIIYLGLLIVRG